MKENRHIFIINGSGGVGKDTFVEICSEFVETSYISIVDNVKKIAKHIGWNGEKTEKDRKMLSDLKILIDEYNNGNYEYVKQKTLDFKTGTNEFEEEKILFICAREKEDIEKIVSEFGAKTILITRESVEHITSNIADANVFDNKYDYKIKNDGDISDLRNAVLNFLNNI